mgnify:CR=1 FL=1
MEAEPKVLYKYRSLYDKNFEYTRCIFTQNTIYFAHPDDFNDPFDCKIPPVENSLRHFITRHQNFGVFSLSENYSNILMWGHYADSHKGICIGFDSEKLRFRFNYEGPCVSGPVQVRYPPDNEYPRWSFFDKVDDAHIETIYFTKAKLWKYEKEWRIILPEQERKLRKIKPKALVSVYLGCQIDKGHRETVIEWCLQRKPRPEIYQMEKHDTSFSLKEIEVLY